MPEKQYVTYGCCGCGCGTELPITGCRFSLAPMCDDFVDVILGAIGRVDTSKVWKKTDRLSTVYRGKACHVEDAVKTCFVEAYREGTHMTMELTFSKGCPGDIDGDSYLAMDDILCNEPNIQDARFPVDCKIALYPMGVTDYMSHIAHIVNRAVDLGIYGGSAHYCTLLSADVQTLFSYISEVNAYCGENLSHYVFEVTLSVNSPTKAKNIGDIF